MKKLPVLCPSCGSHLSVMTMHCCQCETRVEGDYKLPAYMYLTAEEQKFILDFVMCSGSLKEMALQLGLSYPSVRNRLDDVIERLRSYTNK